MLRKADNVSLLRQPTWLTLFTGNAWVSLHVGKTQAHRVAKMTKQQFADADALQHHQVTFVLRIGDRNYWQHQGRFYWDDENRGAPQVHALLATRQQRRDAQIQRAEQTVTMGTMPRQNQRGAISDEVKHFVWTRDGGACRTCGSTTELQFDHVIPVSMGGSGEPENLQILCGPCNRRKGARVSG